MPTATRVLATRKGFALFEDSRLNQFRLVDTETRLPELNPINETVFFSLSEVIEFLASLHDRSSSPKA